MRKTILHILQLNSFKTSRARRTRPFVVAVSACIFAVSSWGQSPSPSPDNGDRYSVKASTEIGARWVDVNGNENKFRSDLNYRTGFRVFDSSIVIEDNSKTGFKSFDTAMILASGWGSDPSGFVRANVERDGLYRFDASVRRSTYFNFLNNHAIGNDKRNLHNADRRRNFGDVDLILLPDNRNIRFRLGYSYNFADGSGSTSTRISRGDVFPAFLDLSTSAQDFRVGADGKLLGFNLSGTYGRRSYRDRTHYSITSTDPGDVPTNANVIFALDRRDPVNGETNFGILSVQRTFAERFDFTAKIIHSVTETSGRFVESVRYRHPTNQQILTDEYNVPWDASRPQTRGDLGMTWRIIDKLRLSNTFTYDGFSINGGNLYTVTTFPAATATRQFSYAVTRYRRYTNTVEGDYQFNDRVGVNVGWRYTQREVRLVHLFDRPVTGPVTPASAEDEENSTNTFLAGTRFKPARNWSIFADVEAGKADNVFTRLGNYEFLNYRIRSRSHFDKFAINASFISKDNDNPGQLVPGSGVPTTATAFVTEVRSRIFSSSIDWNPIPELSLSGGYDYHHLTSEVSVLVPLGAPTLTPGLSQYFVRDHYFFIDAHVRPHKRLTLFGSYRWDKDRGYGDRAIPSLTSPIILSGYPTDFKTPEFRAAVRLSRYVDWNVGYQYYDYREEPIQNFVYGLPLQNYRAHMPYTSLRIYLGRGAEDR